ncbi:unnamed protein product [Leptosia nina]|uniref:Uncharacterized protein n=1 Tax=Leptosia nina TaxID=320188 RepID=A0AAV1K1K5_9NEOP
MAAVPKMLANILLTRHCQPLKLASFDGPPQRKVQLRLRMTWIRVEAASQGRGAANRCVAMATATSAEGPALYYPFLSRFDNIISPQRL